VIIITSASAQSITSGDITGTVTDPSGAAVPDAAVTAVNTNTNATQNTVTNPQGSYRFAFLPPGTYSVTVTAKGFQTKKVSGIAVTASQPATADVKLALAQATQTVDLFRADHARCGDEYAGRLW
jgi:protocatechuate 3,4-dioxygenase beta subunit